MLEPKRVCVGGTFTDAPRIFTISGIRTATEDVGGSVIYVSPGIRGVLTTRLLVPDCPRLDTWTLRLRVPTPDSPSPHVVLSGVITRGDFTGGATSAERETLSNVPSHDVNLPS